MWYVCSLHKCGWLTRNQGDKKWLHEQGCQIFLGTKYQNWKNIPNYHKLYQMSIKYNKRP
jgi:hypothetical protein